MPLHCMKPSTMKLCIFLLSFISFISSHPHPLDPLTPSELSTIHSIITSSPLNLSSLSFHYVGLDEPDKSTILSFSSSSPLPPRRAFAILRANRRTHELIVDVAEASIVSHRVYAGPAYPTFTSEEEAEAGSLPMTHPLFLESVGKRGVRIDDVICTAYTRGWFGEGEETGRRAAVLCFVGGETANFYARPIEAISTVHRRFYGDFGGFGGGGSRASSSGDFGIFSGSRASSSGNFERSPLFSGYFSGDFGGGGGGPSTFAIFSGSRACPARFSEADYSLTF